MSNYTGLEQLYALAIVKGLGGRTIDSVPKQLKVRVQELLDNHMEELLRMA